MSGSGGGDDGSLQLVVAGAPAWAGDRYPAAAAAVAAVGGAADAAGHASADVAGGWRDCRCAAPGWAHHGAVYTGQWLHTCCDIGGWRQRPQHSPAAPSGAETCPGFVDAVYLPSEQIT